MYVPERLTLTAPSLPDDTFALEKPSQAAHQDGRVGRWFDAHEELFQPEPLVVQMVLSTIPSAVPHDAVVTGSAGNKVENHPPRT